MKELMHVMLHTTRDLDRLTLQFFARGVYVSSGQVWGGLGQWYG